MHNDPHLPDVHPSQFPSNPIFSFFFCTGGTVSCSGISGLTLVLKLKRHRSNLFAWIQNNYRETLVEKTIWLESIHAQNPAMWHDAPWRTQTGRRSLWFKVCPAIRKTWVTILFCIDGFLSSMQVSIYHLLSLYLSSIHTHIYLPILYTNIKQI